MMDASLVTDAEVHLLHPEAREPGFARGSDEPVRKAIHEHPDFPSLRNKLGLRNLLDSMTENSIQRSLIMGLPWLDAGRQADNNAYIARCVSDNPGHLKGLYIPHLSDMARAIREIEQLDKSLFAGIKLVASWQGLTLDSPTLIPLWETVRQRGMVAMLHVDHPHQSLAGDTPFRLLSLARREPGLKILATHLGGLLCLYGLLPRLAMDMSNIRFVTSVSATLEMVSFAVRVNPANLVFGSDYPFNHCHDQATVLTGLKTLDTDEKARRAILGGELSRFIGWEGAA